ncbi:DUF2835 domain-containing protein [Salinispirillum marinum]|uniref:DUF2835 domain-containing protein n=2 Tax=Saccharospirillaceae TaxID=255527 RepID=A0ABV8BH21_9GAMM
MSHSIDVSFYISPDDIERMYAGTAKNVYTVSHDGRSVSFPIRILQPFITRNGIQGSFRIHFTDQNKFDRVERLG